MTTYNKDGFLFFKEHTASDSILGDRLIVESSKLSSTIDYVNKKCKSIVINSMYYRIDNLDFLKAIPNLEGLYIIDNRDITSDVLCGLNKLKVLRINSLKDKVDFAAFKDLRVLSLKYSKNIVNLTSCKNLFWLCIENFKSENLLELKGLSNLQYLSLTNSSVVNLVGLDYLSNIQSLSLDSAKKLVSLNGFSENLTSLENVYIYGAKNLSDYDCLGHLKYLKRLDLRSCGSTDSIEFIKNMNSLKTVTLGFKVLDGNMYPLEGLEEVGFIDYPHYNRKMKDFGSVVK